MIGCGLQGYGAALDIVNFGKPQELILADAFPEASSKLNDWLISKTSGTKLTTLKLDAADINAVAMAAKDCELILNATPYKFALDITKAAIQAKVPMVDLGGDTNMVLKQLELSTAAQGAGITIVPDCGMGPGMTNITVGHAMEILDTAESVVTVDGGIPMNPQPPLFYHMVFAIETLTNEYTGRTTYLKDGKIVECDSLEEIIPMEMPVVGKVEATRGMGMLSSLPWTYKDRIQYLDNMFVRYPGHLQFIKTLKQSGFFSREDILTENGKFQPRAMTKAILEKFLQKPDGAKDVSLIQTTSKGMKGNQKLEITHLIVDHSDEKTGLTSMARTTGFTASIVGQMIVDGRLKEKGVLPPELAVPKLEFFDEIQRRGIQFSWSQKNIT